MQITASFDELMKRSSTDWVSSKMCEKQKILDKMFLKNTLNFEHGIANIMKCLSKWLVNCVKVQPDHSLL